MPGVDLDALCLQRRGVCPVKSGGRGISGWNDSGGMAGMDVPAVWGWAAGIPRPRRTGRILLPPLPSYPQLPNFSAKCSHRHPSLGTWTSAHFLSFLRLCSFAIKNSILKRIKQKNYDKGNMFGNCKVCHTQLDSRENGVLLWEKIALHLRIRPPLFQLNGFINNSTVEMNLVTEQQWRCRHREQAYGHRLGRGGRGWDTWREYPGCIYTNICNRQPMGICYMTQETQTGALNNLVVWKWAGGGRKIQEGGDICTPMVNSCWCMTEIKPPKKL